MADTPDYILAAMDKPECGPLLRARKILGARMTWLGGHASTGGGNAASCMTCWALDGHRDSYVAIYRAAGMVEEVSP